MSTWTTATCDLRGVRLHVTRTGGGKPALVLLHGLTHDGIGWSPWARALEADFDVVMPDARGHGSSSTPASGYTYEELAADVVGVIESMRLEAPFLLGHSMGGLTAAVVAARRPTLLRGLVLADPTFLNPGVQREVYADGGLASQHRQLLTRSLADVVAELRARHPHRSAETVELIARGRLATRVEAFEILRPPNPDFRELVRAIRMPTLLIIGGPRGVVSRELALELQALNARIQLQQLPEAGHGLHFDQPERFTDLVRSFLGS